MKNECKHSHCCKSRTPPPSLSFAQSAASVSMQAVIAANSVAKERGLQTTILTASLASLVNISTRKEKGHA